MAEAKLKGGNARLELSVGDLVKLLEETEPARRFVAGNPVFLAMTPITDEDVPTLKRLGRVIETMLQANEDDLDDDPEGDDEDDEDDGVEDEDDDVEDEDEDPDDEEEDDVEIEEEEDVLDG